MPAEMVDSLLSCYVPGEEEQPLQARRAFCARLYTLYQTARFSE